MQKSKPGVPVAEAVDAMACNDDELDSLLVAAYLGEKDAPLPAEYTKQFKTEKFGKGKVAKIHHICDLGFRLGVRFMGQQVHGRQS